MSSLEIKFVSGNEHKIKEAQTILNPRGVDVSAVNLKIHELQTEDAKLLVRDKALKAFQQIGRPLFVEHTGLHLDHLNELPGGLTQIFWDRLQAVRFCELFGNIPNTKVEARTIIGYVDGRKIHFFEGAIRGNISKEPCGSRDFQWDCVFIPTGETKTFSELGVRKNEISMRRLALDKLAQFLRP